MWYAGAMLRALVVATMLAACSKPPPPVQPSPAPPPAKPEPPPPPSIPAEPTSPNAPTTAAGQQLAWLLDIIVHHHGEIDRAAVEAHFAPAALAKLSAERFVAVFAGLGKQIADLAITETTGTDTELVAHATAGGKKLVVSMSVDPGTHRIVSLLFRPDTEAAPRPSSFDEARQMMAALAPKVQLLVAELAGGACKPVYAVASTDELAIGSTFKLYVLLELADRMIAGTLRWDDELAVRDDWKSLPSGITQNDAAGTRLSIRTLAERMISISDNTATDHLLYTLGRKQVEAAVREAKHAQPALDTPFLSTRELFLLKLGPAEELARYTALSEAKRRAYLDTTLAGKVPVLASVADWKTARAIDRLEWFASSEDLCRVMAALWTRARDPRTAPLLDVLAKNPGLPIDKARFPYVGFKGGSEPGVIDLTYLLERADDRWFVVSASFNAAEGSALERDQVFGVVAGVIDALGKQAK